MKQALPIFNYTVRNTSADTIEVNIDGEIVDASTQAIYKEWFGDETTVSFKSFRDEINRAVNSGVKTINGYINSPGGMVTEAMAMHDFIIELQNKSIVVNMTGRGIIASAATYILMASKSSKLTENSWFMIHNVSGVAYGDVNEVENKAKTLRKFNNTVRDFYASATGLPAQTITSMMNNETWLTGKEAADKGFVTAVTGSQQFQNSINPEQWMFNNTSVLSAYNSFTPKNKEEMDLSKITEVIANGFKNIKNSLAGGDNTAIHNTLEEFQNSLVNSIKEAIPTDEAIQALVNTAVNAAFENLPESVSTAISNAVKEGNKGLVTNEGLKVVTDELEEVKNSVINRANPAAPPANKGEKGDGKYNHTGISFE